MELVGEEKKIQELFRELRLENERVTPRFATVWNRAQSRPARPRRAFNLSFALATALLVCALVSLAVWSKRSRPTQQPNFANVDVPPIPTIIPRQSWVKELLVKDQGGSNDKSRSIKLAARREKELLALKRAEIREATAISSWQSPTDTLLRSPSEQVLTTLPQFGDAVNGMKSFLPSRNK